MPVVLADYQQRTTHVRSKILKNEEQRMQLEQRLRAMLTRSSRSDHRRQIQHIHTYFTRLNQQSERAEQRNLNLLNDLTQAQQRLDQLHHDAEHLARLKDDYAAYLESNYPRWQALRSSGASSQLNSSSNEYDRLVQHIKHNPLESDGNLRQSGKFARGTRVFDLAFQLR
jgi:chromosome segregation ATPase